MKKKNTFQDLPFPIYFSFKNKTKQKSKLTTTTVLKNEK